MTRSAAIRLAAVAVLATLAGCGPYPQYDDGGAGYYGYRSRPAPYYGAGGGMMWGTPSRAYAYPPQQRGWNNAPPPGRHAAGPPPGRQVAAPPPVAARPPPSMGGRPQYMPTPDQTGARAEGGGPNP